MKHKCGIVLAVVIAVSSCSAQDIIGSPYDFGSSSVLDGIADMIVTDSRISATVLEVLELVALGRASAIRKEAEIQFGLTPGRLKTPVFAQPSARVRAIQQIGECGLPEALDFLKNLKRADLGEDPSQTLWPNARLTLRKALLARIADPAAKTEFLVSTLTEEGHGATLTGYWAANLLCDQGVSTALPLVRQSFRSDWPGPSGQEAIRFCETRMQIVSRDPDRVKALRTVLTLDGTSSERLLVWAIDQLNSLHSESADAELDRFADVLEEGASQNGRFRGVWYHLHRIRGTHVK